jgi:hypothetical protein
MRLQQIASTITAANPIQITTDTYSIIQSDVLLTGYYATFQTIVTGTATYSIELNLGILDTDIQNINTTYGQIIPDPNGWFTHYPNLTNQTTGQVVVADPMPINFIRINISAGTVDSQVILKYLQQGLVR